MEEGGYGVKEVWLLNMLKLHWGWKRIVGKCQKLVNCSSLVLDPSLRKKNPWNKRLKYSSYWLDSVSFLCDLFINWYCSLHFQTRDEFKQLYCFIKFCMKNFRKDINAYLNNFCWNIWLLRCFLSSRYNCFLCNDSERKWIFKFAFAEFRKY